MSVTHATPYGAGPTKIGAPQWEEPHAASFGEFYETGDWKFAGRKSVPTGWISSSTLTIGNVGSGASYANANALALFTLWWTEWTNAELAILTSAGGASTRGASAAADWAALKRMTVLPASGRFLRVPGSINGLTITAGETRADTLKDHTHLTPQTGSTGGSAPRFSFVANDGTKVLVTDSPSTGASAETAPVSLVVPGFWKL